MEAVATLMATINTQLDMGLLATARIKVYSSHGRVAYARALLDQGSEATLISENLAQTLRLPRERRNICVTGIEQSESLSRSVTTSNIGTISSIGQAYTTTAIVFGVLTRYKPDCNQKISGWRHLRNLPLADDDPMSSDPIDIIIGSTLYGVLLRKGLRKGKLNEPIAQNTVFGWIVSGCVSQDRLTTKLSTQNIVMDEVTFDLRKFWEIENLLEQTFLSPNEQRCEDYFSKTHSRNADGQYVIRLPFKLQSDPKLGESRSSAVQKFEQLERQLQRDITKTTAYREFVAEYEALGHMTKIPEAERHKTTMSYYIPYHAVFRESSQTTRLRVVFNASSKSSNGKSLNEFLAPGPKLQTDLVSIILRWRQFRYIFTADIARMYRQIFIDPRDADYQRIVWSSPLDRIEEYKFQTVTYGTTSAPYLAICVLNQLAADESAQYSLALPVIQQLTYVDDCIFGADNQVLATQTREQLTALLAKGGFTPRKWASNCPSLLTNIDPNDHGLACDKDLLGHEPLHILGISWLPNRNSFCFKFTITGENAKTKRTMLSIIAKLFDPLGWITPVILTAKHFIQRLWMLNCGWDDALPPTLVAKWNQFHSQLPILKRLSIPRWTENSTHTNYIEIHGFADASTKAYAAVVYLKVVSFSGSVIISLMIAKSKVAPIKTLSIPRLELYAALLLTRLITDVKKMLSMPTVQR